MELYSAYINSFGYNKYVAAVRRADEIAETLREQGEEVCYDMLLDSALEDTKWDLPTYEEDDLVLYGRTRLWFAIASDMVREIRASGVKKMVTIYKG